MYIYMYVFTYTFIFIYVRLEMQGRWTKAAYMKPPWPFLRFLYWLILFHTALCLK